MARTSNSIGRPSGIRGGLRVQTSASVEIDPRPVYDFLLSLDAEAEDLLPEDAKWLATKRLLLPEEFRPGKGGEAAVCVGFAAELSRVVVRRPEIATGRQLVEAVRQMSDRELVDEVLGELLETPELSVLTRRAIDGHQGARDELAAQIGLEKGDPHAAWNFDLLAPVIRQALEIWLEPWEEIEARIGRMQERDAAIRHSQLEDLPALDFVERATNGIRLVPGQRTRRIVLSPTYFMRPFNFVTRAGDVELVCYPMADEALDAGTRTAPPSSVVRLYRALGDETRLRILRLLAERDWYLTELATELELSKPTIKHHLAQLRSAGLVTMTEEGNLTYYSLRRDRVESAGSELTGFLAH